VSSRPARAEYSCCPSDSLTKQQLFDISRSCGDSDIDLGITAFVGVGNAVVNLCVGNSDADNVCD